MTLLHLSRPQNKHIEFTANLELVCSLNMIIFCNKPMRLGVILYYHNIACWKLTNGRTYLETFLTLLLSFGLSDTTKNRWDEMWTLGLSGIFGGIMSGEHLGWCELNKYACLLHSDSFPAKVILTSTVVVGNHRQCQLGSWHFVKNKSYIISASQSLWSIF